MTQPGSEGQPETSRIPMREIELALAQEAADHALAALELNPFGEAETLELGEARAVYCGAWSPVHGVFGLGLDGPVEARDLQEVNKFYYRKERAPSFWACPATDPTLLELLRQDYRAVKSLPVHGMAPGKADSGLPEAGGNSKPDHNEWARSFTKLLDPAANEPGLLALTKLHEKNCRFYLGPSSASYTHFSRGIAVVPFPGAHSLLSLQEREAREFRSSFFATASASPLPLLYERTLYERL